MTPDCKEVHQICQKLSKGRLHPPPGGDNKTYVYCMTHIDMNMGYTTERLFPFPFTTSANYMALTVFGGQKYFTPINPIELPPGDRVRTVSANGAFRFWDRKRHSRLVGPWSKKSMHCVNKTAFRINLLCFLYMPSCLIKRALQSKFLHSFCIVSVECELLCIISIFKLWRQS